MLGTFKLWHEKLELEKKIIMLCWVMHREDLEAISKWGMHNALVIESSINWAITSHTRFSAKASRGRVARSKPGKQKGPLLAVGPHPELLFDDKKSLSK